MQNRKNNFFVCRNSKIHKFKVSCHTRPDQKFQQDYSPYTLLLPIFSILTVQGSHLFPFIFITYVALEFCNASQGNLGFDNVTLL